MADGSLPSSADVKAYLSKHQLESVLEAAVNQAVTKLAEDPFSYIAEQLSEHVTRSKAKSKRRVSLSGGPLELTRKQVCVSEDEMQDITRQEKRGYSNTEVGHKPRKPSVVGFLPAGLAVEVETSMDEEAANKGENRQSGEDLKREYVKKDVLEVSPELEEKLKAFFDKMDCNGDGTVTKDEAILFWGTNFAKVNANSMFNEVDENGDCEITWPEFLDFWKNVVGSGYAGDDILEEVEMMLEGGSWVDFDDGRTT